MLGKRPVTVNNFRLDVLDFMESMIIYGYIFCNNCIKLHDYISLLLKDYHLDNLKIKLSFMLMNLLQPEIMNICYSVW